MRVLGIYGGTRRHGNSETLLDKALRGAQSRGAAAEKVVLLGLRIGPCLDCADCEQGGPCPLPDDMTSLYPRLRESERIIFSSPIYFRSLPGVAKLMVDRCQSFWVERRLGHAVGPPGRKGLFIATAGQGRAREFEAALPVVRAFFAVLQVRFCDPLLYGGMEDKQDILRHPSALQEAFEAGARLVDA